MEWFGPGPFSPACLDTRQATPPVGQACAWCAEPVADGDSGYLVPHLETPGTVTLQPWHVECLLRSTLGSLAHLEHRCSCYVPGADEGDDPALTKRQAAQAAERFLHAQHMHLLKERR